MVADPAAALQGGAENAVDEHSGESGGYRNPALGRKKHPTHRCNRRHHQAGRQACDGSGNRDAAVGPCRDAFPGRNQPRLCAAVLPDFASHGVSSRFGESRRCRDQPNPISGGAENDGCERGYRQIRQHLPGIPAFPALGQPECQLAAVSKAGRYPGHHKQGCEGDESRRAYAGKKRETGETPRQSSGEIDAAHGSSQHREAQRHGRSACQSLRR